MNSQTEKLGRIRERKGYLLAMLDLSEIIIKRVPEPLAKKVLKEMKDASEKHDKALSPHQTIEEYK